MLGTRTRRTLSCLGTAATVVGLVTAPGVAAAAPSGSDAPTQQITVDPDSPGRVFDGVGSLSAGASSRLLVDYPEPERSEILDYLFTPGYGASQHILKVEIGGDTNSTDGTEPSHMHWRDDLDCHRGYEWWLMHEAKERNPDILLSALAWGAPGWIGGGDFWSQDMIDYLVAWLDCAKGQGLRIDYLGGWNERGFDKQWYIDLRASLDANGYSGVRIVAADGTAQNWTVATAMREDPEFAAVVDVIGVHYPCGWRGPAYECPASEDALALDKPLSASEQGSLPYDTGVMPWARALNRDYVDGKMTSTINWATVWSAYHGLPYEGSGLMQANEPWSGHYDVGPTIWATAHTTQFAQPGWRYLDSGSVRLDEGGSVATLRAADGDDWSSVVETTDADGPQRLEYTVGDGLATGDVHVWASDLRSDDPRDWFVQQDDIEVEDGTFTLEAQPGHVYSVTTTTGQGKGDADSPPSTAWRMPYHEDFEGYELGETVPMFSDLGGVFETAECAERRGQCLRNVIDVQPIQWNNMANYPITIVGDPENWRNYRVSVDALLEDPGAVELAGRATNGSNGYRFHVEADGAWTLSRPGTVLAEGRTEFGANRWHTMTLDMNDDRVTAMLDGRVLAEVRDTEYTAGQVALVSNPWTNVQFDRFRVTPHNQPGVPEISDVAAEPSTLDQPGQEFTVRATVHNDGPSFSFVRPELDLPDGWTAELNDHRWPFLVMWPGRTVDLEWTVRAADEVRAGLYPVRPTARYWSAGESDTVVGGGVAVEYGQPVPSGQMTATATSAQEPDYAAGKAIDDDRTSMWHTQWDPTRDTLPQSIAVDLGGQHDLSSLAYYPRDDDNLNGVITSYRIEVSADGNTWTEAASGTWAADATPKVVELAGAYRYVRITALEGWNGYGSAAEIDVYGQPAG